MILISDNLYQMKENFLKNLNNEELATQIPRPSVLVRSKMILQKKTTHQAT